MSDDTTGVGTTAPPAVTGALDETYAMRECHRALAELDRKAQHRVMNWITARLYDDADEGPF